MKYSLYFGIFCVTASWLALLILAYLLFWPVRTLELVGYDDSHPIAIENTVVHKGDALKYTLDYCKYTNRPSTVHRTFIDGQIIILTPTQGQLPTGCHTANLLTSIVPSTINPGRYYLDVVVEYKINPFHTEYIHYKTTYFTVVK